MLSLCSGHCLILLSAYQRKRIQGNQAEGWFFIWFFPPAKRQPIANCFFCGCLRANWCHVADGNRQLPGKYILQSPEAGSLLVGSSFAATFSIQLWKFGVRRWGQWNVWLIGEIGLFLTSLVFFVWVTNRTGVTFALRAGRLSCCFSIVFAANYYQLLSLKQRLQSPGVGFSLFTFKVAMGLAVFVPELA